MDLVYLGLPRGALALLEAGHRLAAAGLSRKGETSALLRRSAMDQRFPLLYRPDLNDVPTRTLICSTRVPLLVCYLWDHLLPGEVIDAFPQGALSYHPSLLPRHRGPDPYFWTIWLGDEQVGVSVLRLDEGMDTGPVVAQRALPVPPDLEGGALADLLDPLGLDLLLEVLDQWPGSGPCAIPSQDEARASGAPAPPEDLLEIRWSWRAERIARLIRAAAPHPGAFTFIGNEPVVVLAAHPGPVAPVVGLEPGDALMVPEGFMVQAGEGTLILDLVRLSDGRSLCGRAEIARGLGPEVLARP